MFSKMALTIFILFFGFIKISKPKNLRVTNFIIRFPENKKVILIILLDVQYWPHKKMFCSLKSNRDYKLLIIKRYIWVNPVVFELKPKKQLNEWQTSGNFQTWSIVFWCFVIKPADRPPRKRCYQSSEIHFLGT